MLEQIEALERDILEKSLRLAELRRQAEAPMVPDYDFETAEGTVKLSALFEGRDHLLLIHNMGEACRYCTLWADGLNGVLHHLEDAMSVRLTSKDPPETQRCFALDRGWRFRLVSHGGGRYMMEQCSNGDYENLPGAAIYEMSGDKILRRGFTQFGPGDLYSPVWHVLGLAGLGADSWTPQFHYWQSPAELEDGGVNRNDRP